RARSSLSALHTSGTFHALQKRSADAAHENSKSFRRVYSNRGRAQTDRGLGSVSLLILRAPISALRLRDDEGLRVEFAAVEGARALHVERASGHLYAASLLLQLVEAHAGYAFGREVEPLAYDYLAVVRRARVGLALLQALLDEHVGEQAVSQL